MSRSVRAPYVGTCGTRRGAMKKWKRQNNRRVRRVLEVPSGKYYKKINEMWDAPDDGKSCWQEEKWAYRK